MNNNSNKSGKYNDSRKMADFIKLIREIPSMPEDEWKKFEDNMLIPARIRDILVGARKKGSTSENACADETRNTRRSILEKVRKIKSGRSGRG
ncbi:MAG: hypothetical protein ACLFQK_12210 [Fibrobacterota bacterium]